MANLPGYWPGDRVRDPSGEVWTVTARGIRDGERYLMLVAYDGSVALRPMSSEGDLCGYEPEVLRG